MDEIREAIKFATAVAEEAAEKYRVAVFAEVLRLRLSGVGRAGPLTSQDRGKGTTKAAADARKPSVVAHSVSRRGSRKQQAVWAVMRLAEKGEEAINETIRGVIKTELSVTPQSRMDTNTTLRKLTPKYVRREKREEGKGLRYFPTAHSPEIFEGLEE
jgi:hypothetical protein